AFAGNGLAHGTIVALFGDGKTTQESLMSRFRAQCDQPVAAIISGHGEYHRRLTRGRNPVYRTREGIEPCDSTVREAEEHSTIRASGTNGAHLSKFEAYARRCNRVFFLGRLLFLEGGFEREVGIADHGCFPSAGATEQRGDSETRPFVHLDV